MFYVRYSQQLTLSCATPQSCDGDDPTYINLTRVRSFSIEYSTEAIFQQNMARSTQTHAGHIHWGLYIFKTMQLTRKCVLDNTILKHSSRDCSWKQHFFKNVIEWTFKWNWEWANYFPVCLAHPFWMYSSYVIIQLAHISISLNNIEYVLFRCYII